MAVRTVSRDLEARRIAEDLTFWDRGGRRIAEGLAFQDLGARGIAEDLGGQRITQDFNVQARGKYDTLSLGQ